MESRIRRCSIRCKRKREGYPYLAIEIIFNILSWLPAEFLHNQVKYVCKTWASIIRDPSFVETHLLRSNANCFLIQNTVKRGNLLRCLEVKERKFTITRRSININPENELIVASSGGISLSRMMDDDVTLYVTNFVTKQRLKLPFIYPKTCKTVFVFVCSLAYIPQTKELKVIVPWLHHDGYAQYSVFTVGGDSHTGREIDTGVRVIVDKVFHIRPISINGVIYWIHYIPEYNLLAIDLRDETSHNIKMPEKSKSNSGGDIRFLRMDNYLSFIEHGGTEINVWILKNIVISEWVITRKIELPSVVGLRQPLLLDIWHHIPVAWLDNARVILFVDRKENDGYSSFFAYNLSTGVIKSITNVNHINAFYALLHTNTLVAW